MPATLPPSEDKPGVPMPPPLFFALPLLAAFLLEWWLPSGFVSGWPRWLVGGAFVGAGIALDLGGFAVQRRAGTDPIPFRPTTLIVTRGPYRFSRNPMYVGFALWTVGIALMGDSAWALLALPVGVALVDRLVIAREERYLERKFGEEYLAYKRRVRRWL